MMRRQAEGPPDGVWAFKGPHRLTRRRRRRLAIDQGGKGRPPPTTKDNKRVLSSLRALLREFLTSSSIHGMAYLLDRKPLEILLWLVLITLAGMGALSISLSTLNRFRTSPTVISVERDHWEWNTSFPAVTVCPLLTTSETQVLYAQKERALESLAMEMAKEIQGSGEVYNETERVGALVAFLRTLRSTSLRTLSSLMPFASMQDLLPPAERFQDLFLRCCSFPGQLQPNFTFGTSGSAFVIPPAVPVLTEMGLCYSIFSSVGALNATSTSRPKGPYTVGNPLDGALSAQLVEMSHGYQCYVHSPNDKADVAARPVDSPANHYTTIHLAPYSIITTEEARFDLTVDQRKCRFQEEVSDAADDIYSHNLCRSHCRVRLAIELCSCVPYFFQTIEEAAPCNVEGLLCLAKHKDLLIKLQGPSINDDKDLCDCLPMCEDVNYLIIQQTIIEWPFGTSLKWGILKYPRTRHKRDVLFDFSHLLGAIGGTAGLFLGCSLLSAVEVVYFATLRAFWKIAHACRAPRVNFSQNFGIDFDF